MPTGLKIPVGVNESGGAAIVREETEQNKKILILGLSEGGDKNPFQQLGLDGSLVFAVKDTQLRGRALEQIERFLKKYPERFALKPGTPVKFDYSTENEVEISFEYVDLLTNETKEFTDKVVR